MSRKNGAPTYHRHKTSGRGFTLWRDALTVRHSRLHPGRFGSKESKAAHARLCLELATSPSAAVNTDAAGWTTAQVLALYLDYAERRYRGGDGKLSSEFRDHKLVMGARNRLYGDDEAGFFGPIKFKALRQNWVDQDLSRSECNRRANIARRIIKWAAPSGFIDLSISRPPTVGRIASSPSAHAARKCTGIRTNFDIALRRGSNSFVTPCPGSRGLSRARSGGSGRHLRATALPDSQADALALECGHFGP